MNATLTCIAKVPNTLERGGGGSAISKKWQKFRCPSGAQVTELNRFKWGALCQIRKCVLTDLPSTLNGLREGAFYIWLLRHWWNRNCQTSRRSHEARVVQIKVVQLTWKGASINYVIKILGVSPLSLIIIQNFRQPPTMT